MANRLIVFASALFAGTNAFNLTSTGSTVELNGIPYYLPGKPFASLPYFSPQTLAGVKGLLGGLVPVTLVGTASADFTVEELGKTVQGFGEKDDVWGEGFLSGKWKTGFGSALVGTFFSVSFEHWAKRWCNMAHVFLWVYVT